MTPKTFIWLLRNKARKIVFSPIPGPNGGSYMLELRQGVSTVVKKEVSRHTVERYIGNTLRVTLEDLVKEIDAITDDEESEDED